MDSANTLLRTLARIIISAVMHLKRVLVHFAVKHSSLKTLASLIVFGLYNKQKSSFDNVTTCTPLEILEIPDYALLNIFS